MHYLVPRRLTLHFYLSPVFPLSLPSPCLPSFSFFHSYLFLSLLTQFSSISCFILFPHWAYSTAPSRSSSRSPPCPPSFRPPLLSLRSAALFPLSCTALWRTGDHVPYTTYCALALITLAFRLLLSSLTRPLYLHGYFTRLKTPLLPMKQSYLASLLLKSGISSPPEDFYILLLPPPEMRDARARSLSPHFRRAARTLSVGFPLASPCCLGFPVFAYAIPSCRLVPSAGSYGSSPGFLLLPT